MDVVVLSLALVDVPDRAQMKAELDTWRNPIADRGDQRGLVLERPVDPLVNRHIEILRAPLVFLELDLKGKIDLYGEIVCRDRFHDRADLARGGFFGEREKLVLRQLDNERAVQWAG